MHRFLCQGTFSVETDAKGYDSRTIPARTPCWMDSQTQCAWRSADRTTAGADVWAAMEADGRKCFKCGKTGHLRKDCPEKHSAERRSVKCFTCGRHGHYQNECPNAAGAKSGPSKPKGKAASKKELHESCYPTCSQKFVDTHCHLEYVFERYRHTGSFADFKGRFPMPENFDGCVVTFCDPAAFSSFGLWREFLSEIDIWGTFGCHPHNANYYTGDLEVKIIQCLDHPKAVALGEIGLDYSPRSPAPPERQKDVLQKQARWAVELGKPVVIHCRDAEADLMEILKSSLPRDWKIHLHCFTGSACAAQKFLKEFPNLYVGITGLVTFAKTKEIHELAYDVPLERLLLETDAPYFVPSQVSKQNKWSHPGMALYVADRIAEIKKIPVDEVLEATRRNTSLMYNIWKGRTCQWLKRWREPNRCSYNPGQNVQDTLPFYAQFLNYSLSPTPPALPLPPPHSHPPTPPCNNIGWQSNAKNIVEGEGEVKVGWKSGF